jgi:hypothetical protein
MEMTNATPFDARYVDRSHLARRLVDRPAKSASLLVEGSAETEEARPVQ